MTQRPLNIEEANRLYADTPDYGGKTYAEEAHGSAVVAAYCFCAGCLIVIGGLAYGAGKLAGKW